MCPLATAGYQQRVQARHPEDGPLPAGPWLGAAFGEQPAHGVLTMEDQGWLARTSVEVISRSKLQRLAIISSMDMLQQLTNEVLDSRVKEVSPHFFHTQYFLSEQSALEWLIQP